MTRKDAIEYWEGLRKTFSSQLEQEENYFGRMHLQTTIDAIDMAISALRQQETVTDRHQMTNADRIRAMSDEELAEFLTCINPTNCQDCAFSHGWRCQPDRYDYSSFEKCKEGRKRWLQQPAEEADHVV